MGFNGATTFQPWKSERKRNLQDIGMKLQWGHDFSAVEMVVAEDASERLKFASMGPRLFSRGNISPLIELNSPPPLQWGHDFSAVEIRLWALQMLS